MASNSNTASNSKSQGAITLTSDASPTEPEKPTKIATPAPSTDNSPPSHAAVRDLPSTSDRSPYVTKTSRREEQIWDFKSDPLILDLQRRSTLQVPDDPKKFDRENQFRSWKVKSVGKEDNNSSSLVVPGTKRSANDAAESDTAGENGKKAKK